MKTLMVYLEREFGEHYDQKRGWHGALTSFAVEFGAPQKGVCTELKSDTSTTTYLRNCVEIRRR
jgi:hypothetical protein